MVLLHGRGSHEDDIIGLADHLPTGFRYAAVRAPIAEGGGFAGSPTAASVGRLAESLAATMGWFRAWLDTEVSGTTPVTLVGFSGGAAFAGGSAARRPRSWGGAAVLLRHAAFDAVSRPRPGVSPTVVCSWPTATRTP